MRKCKVNTIVEVHWSDIIQDPAWMSMEEACKEPDDKVITVGYFNKMDKKYLYLSTTVMTDRRDKITIPLGCITKVLYPTIRER